MSSIREKYGRGNARASQNNTQNFKLVDGDNVYRILPPMKSLRELGNGWVKYHKVHFGYGIIDEKDPSKLRLRPFECIEVVNFQTKMIEVSCPACREIEAREAACEDLEKATRDDLKAQGVLDPVQLDAKVEIALREHKKWLSTHNVDKKYYVNAKNEAGQFGTLRLPYRAYEAVKNKMNELEASDNIEALNIDNGCWFVFKRSGVGLKTLYAVDIATDVEVRDGKKSRTLRLAPLTDAELEQADKDCVDLATCVRRITPDNIRMIVESGGDPEMVKLVFNGAEREASPARTPAPAAAATLPRPSVNLPLSAVIKQVVAEATAPVAAVEADDEEAKLLAQLAAIKAAKSAAKPVAAVSVPAPKIIATDMALDPDLDPADFARMFPGPK